MRTKPAKESLVMDRFNEALRGIMQVSKRELNALIQEEKVKSEAQKRAASLFYGSVRNS